MCAECGEGLVGMPMAFSICEAAKEWLVERGVPVTGVDGGGGSQLTLIPGHGNWEMPLPPSLKAVRAAFADAPWANYKGWDVAMAERVLSRAGAGLSLSEDELG